MVAPDTADGVEFVTLLVMMRSSPGANEPDCSGAAATVSAEGRPACPRRAGRQRGGRPEGGHRQCEKRGEQPHGHGPTRRIRSVSMHQILGRGRWDVAGGAPRLRRRNAALLDILRPSKPSPRAVPRSSPSALDSLGHYGKCRFGHRAPGRTRGIRAHRTARGCFRLRRPRTRAGGRFGARRVPGRRAARSRLHDLRATPDEILAIVAPIADTHWDIGRAFGTIGARFGAHTVEITTYRADVYDGQTRKPVVEFGSTLEGDLIRRDFTVNALALRLPQRVLVDPSGGVDDLLAGR